MTKTCHDPGPKKSLNSLHTDLTDHSGLGAMSPASTDLNLNQL